MQSNGEALSTLNTLIHAGCYNIFRDLYIKYSKTESDVVEHIISMPSSPYVAIVVRHTCIHTCTCMQGIM